MIKKNCEKLVKSPGFEFLNFEHLNLFRISDLEFRILKDGV